MYLGPWKLDEHRRLFAAALNAKSLGANVFISNSDKPGTREIYQGNYHEIRVARTVEPGSKLKAAKRIPAQEVLIEI
jgi:site-specific DNA-adenine methylase